MTCVLCWCVQLEQLLEGVSDRVDTLSLVPDMATSKFDAQLQVSVMPPTALASTLLHIAQQAGAAAICGCHVAEPCHAVYSCPPV